MKFVNSINLHVLIFETLILLQGVYNLELRLKYKDKGSNNPDDIDMTDIGSLSKAVYKFNLTISNQKLKIDKLVNYTDTLMKENEQLKETIRSSKNNTKKIEMDSPNAPIISTNLIPELSSAVNKVLEFNSFYQQIELQIAREKELRQEVNSKLKEIDDSERRIDKIYNDINYSVKQKVNDLEGKYKQIEAKNYDFSQRLFVLEKEKEKEQLKRNTQKLMNYDITTIEPDCINRNSCSVCLEDPKCVWCSIEKRCKSGDMSGPYDGSCMDSFTYSTCFQSECIKFSTCAECIQTEHCGWCERDSKCVDGNDRGPIGLSCKSKFIHISGYERCSHISNRKMLK